MAGEMLAAGRTAEVYALDAERVVKRYTMDMFVTREVNAMRHAYEHGYPAPRVLDADGESIVMVRVDGPTMGSLLAAGQLAADEAGRTLAALHDRLHRLPPMGPGDGDATVIHLDLHPENVIMSADGPIVIDWANAVDGEAGLDVALSAVILGQVVLEPQWAQLPGTELLRAFSANSVTESRHIDRAVGMRLDNPTMSAGELSRLPAAGDLVRAAYGVA